MRLPIRSAAITLHDDKILLMWRKKKGREFYVFPGGGAEEGETNEETAVREVWEETSIKVSVERLLYHHHLVGDIPESRDSDQYFFLARYLSGEPTLQDNTNEAQSQESGQNFYQPVWFDLKQLATITLYPLQVRDWLVEDLASGFKANTREHTWKLSEIPQ